MRAVKNHERPRGCHQKGVNGNIMEEQSQAVNILPLGDSITDGAGTYSGYRFFLHNLLYKSGINFRFAGTKKAYDPRMPERYYYHAGYGGNTIGPDNSRNGNIFSHLEEIMREKIDIILLMMGRNNYFQSIDLDRIDTVYYNFIHEILKYQPDVHIFIGTMNYSKAGNTPNDPALSGLNRLLPSVYKRLYDEGHNVHFVDIAAVTNLGKPDFNDYDNTHPNDVGQEKIAKAWFDEILPVAKELSDRTKKPDSVRVSGLSLNKSELHLAAGEEYQLKPVFTPENPDEFTVFWHSSNESAVKINSLGRLTAVGCGSAEIIAESLDGGFTAKCEIDVKEADITDKTVLFENAFDSSERWTGNTEIIADGQIVMWFIRRDFKLESKETIKTSDRFQIEVDYEIKDNKGKYFGSYASFKLNGLEMRICEGASSAKILYNGNVLGSWNSYFDIERRIFTLRYDRGKITLFKGGEVLIETTQEIKPAASKIEVYSSEGERFCFIRGINIFNLK